MAFARTPSGDKKAFEVYLKMKEMRQLAEQGDADAQYEMSLFSYQLKNKEEAEGYDKILYWCNKAIEQNHPKALCLLGKLYYNGRGVPQDDKRAFEYFEKSAKGGYAGGQYELACRYFLAEGVEKNLAKAIELYEQSASQAYRKAEFILRLIPQAEKKATDSEKSAALKFFKNLADKGEKDAIKILAELEKVSL